MGDVVRDADGANSVEVDLLTGEVLENGEPVGYERGLELRRRMREAIGPEIWQLIVESVWERRAERDR